MTSRNRLVGVFLMGLALAGCFGRIHDGATGRKINPKDYGLDETRPALMVFGAAWCKPCMSEIHSLNRANAELAADIQIAGFVVEGAQKGVAAAPKDDELFVTPQGEHPTYKLTTDTSWRLFDSLQPGSGHSLPTMVFVNRDHQIIRVVQRSMEYETELLPLLRALASGQVPPPVPPAGPVTPPDPKPAPGENPAGKPVTEPFATWATQVPADTAVYQNVAAAWQHGLEDFTFMEDDMPFTSARMTIFAYDDGRTKPISAVWIAATTGCRLTVYFNPDGSYLKSEGVCR